MQQMLVKIEGANEIMSKADLRACQLLEKHAKLQEESIQNEREFLNVFKSLADSMRSNH